MLWDLASILSLSLSLSLSLRISNPNSIPLSLFLAEHLDVESLQPGLFNTENLKFEEELLFSTPSVEDKMPFLQMLQSVESPPIFPFKEPNFQTLLKLQHLKKPWNNIINSYNMPETEIQIQPLELESCVTHDLADLHSPVKSETKDLRNPHSNSCLESACPTRNHEQGEPNPSRAHPPPETQFSKSSIITRERRKRKRTRPAKNKEEVESQRMTHIAVERNRRRQMNEHLNSLRSLMPPSYVHRGDQASIIGGAIDFVKELEQLLQSLEAQKLMRNIAEGISSEGLFRLLQCNILGAGGGCEEEAKANEKSEAAEIDVTAVQNHVSLKIQCPRSPGQLLRAIVALEDLRLTVLHLNITSSHATVLYSFNLKIEEDCELRSTDEVAAAAHQIFNIIER